MCHQSVLDYSHRSRAIPRIPCCTSVCHWHQASLSRSSIGWGTRSRTADSRRGTKQRRNGCKSEWENQADTYHHRRCNAEESPVEVGIRRRFASMMGACTLGNMPGQAVQNLARESRHFSSITARITRSEELRNRRPGDTRGPNVQQAKHGRDRCGVWHCLRITFGP